MLKKEFTFNLWIRKDKVVWKAFIKPVSADECRAFVERHIKTTKTIYNYTLIRG